MKLENNWHYKSLFNLKMVPMAHPEDAPTPLIKRVYELTNRPLNEYTIENLRLMIGQEIALTYLIPLAIEKLNEDLFAEGDFYEGDLLANVLNIEPEFWVQNPNLLAQVNSLIEHKRDEIISRKISLKKINTVI